MQSAGATCRLRFLAGPGAAKVLATLLEKLCSASARGRRGNLAVVRTMAEKGDT
jgi:hypothetical protein